MDQCSLYSLQKHYVFETTDPLTCILDPFTHSFLTHKNTTKQKHTLKKEKKKSTFKYAKIATEIQSLIIWKCLFTCIRITGISFIEAQNIGKGIFK